MMDWDEIFVYFMKGLLVFLIFLVVVCIPLFCIDGEYYSPLADEKANKWCRDRGYDYFESYSRVGLFNTNPIAIKCKYVEQARKIDLNVNGGIEDGNR